LAKLPASPVTSYRGLDLKTAEQKKAFQSNLRPGDNFAFPSLSSSSPDRPTGESFIRRDDGTLSPGGVLLVIQGKTGREISSYSLLKGEKEVLFAKGTTFTITKQVGHRIYLKEIP